MQTGANSFVNGVLDVLASVCSFLFGGHEGLRRVGPVEIAKPRPPIADIDVRIAINATGFHLVHCVIDEKFVYTSTSQRGGLIPIDRSLTPLDLDGSIEQRLVKTIKSIFDTHEEWVDLGKPTQMLNPSTIEKAEAKLNPVAAANRKPKKPVPVHTVHGAGAPKDGVPLSEIRDFFLDQPSSLDLKR